MRRVTKYATATRVSIFVFVLLAIVATVLTLQVGRGQALPANPQDETKVPHYYGPWSNYANSPFTLPDVTVTIAGDGTGAAAAASVGANGAITGITITDPGNGYTIANVNITSANGAGAAAHAAITGSGAVTQVTVDTPGSGYTAPVVSFSGGGSLGVPMTVGNAVIARAYATDYVSPAANPVPVFVVVPTALPTGTLTNFQTYNQAQAGGSPTSSAGQTFNAYVLRPTGTAGQYTVVFDSGTLTVPALATTGVSQVDTYPVSNVAIQAGDVIGFYGAGIPVDTGSGVDVACRPVTAAPAVSDLVAVDGSDPAFPPLGDARTYSIRANVYDTSGVVTPTQATATAYGGVDSVTITAGGLGYTAPTVDFDLPDLPDGVQAQAHADMDANGTITAIIIDSPGSGYASPPGMAIIDGPRYSPIAHDANSNFAEATATNRLKIDAIVLDTFGSNYQSAPTVTITDPTGSSATATATIESGAVTGITLDAAGAGYTNKTGMKKFVDGLPMLCDPSVGCTDNNLGQHLPLAVADTATFSDSDYYVIALVQNRERMSSSLPSQGTLLRQYVQLETPANASWSKHVALRNELVNGTSEPALMPDGSQAYAVDDPHYLGPVISATKDKAVRIVFYNLLPTGGKGDLFLPVDTTFMGAGMGPMDMMDPVDQGTVMDAVRNPACGEPNQNMMSRMECFADTRATLHLHGGITPWISDGSPHQWITPADEMTGWPEGVAVRSVPDMVGGSQPAGVPDCSADDDGCMTFYYTNQQSARLMFYHDHAWGITRLNVYAGEAAGYLISDATEQKLIADGAIPTDQIPLIIQDKTFVPSDEQMFDVKDTAGNTVSYGQDPTWDKSRWGGLGNLWYEHVYMPAQNPNDPGGMSAFGRWMYGPWFWPPSDSKYGPINNPYYDASCDLDNPTTWQYQTDPFCEPPLIPGTPNNSAGMEQFNDTPTVNGTAYPTLTVDPKSYRLRILNAANDRFFNLQWYVADATTASADLNAAGSPIGGTEVAFKAAELEAAQTDPNVAPTPDTAKSPVGPSWIQIGTEGGFLPAPVVVPNQPITWITDPTRFDVGNVDQHSLLVAPAERADVIVDFSKYAGKTLILYNDAPAAFPARVATYDYYTGAPDMSPAGAPLILPGYGPNTRTVMQVKVAATTPAATFNLTKLRNAFKHHADGSGVFESGQNPTIVGQAAYNSAYGTSFAASGWCNSPTNPSAKCDGFARISEQGGDTFKFDTLSGNRVGVKIEPKAIHDEQNATNFEPFGRMSGNIGVEAVPATPNGQNIILYPFVNPPTELIDATNLPHADVKVTPISTMPDGTQIWKFTHNGVDTHPIHFHLYDVQVLNRVTWDGIIMAPDANEVGWKDTVRVSPLEDTYFAIRPIIPKLPWELPNSIRPMSPEMPLGSTAMFNSTDPSGNPTNPIANALVNFGWEYMLHCHILSHEEMDMMRPVALAVPPVKPDGLTVGINAAGTTATLQWNDNSIAETGYVVQRGNGAGGWTDVATIPSPLDQPNTTGARTYDDTTYGGTLNPYRVVAKNTIGYGVIDPAYPQMTAQSMTAEVTPPPPTITVTSPNGGESWANGTTHNLTWTVSSAVSAGEFQVWLYDGAGNWVATSPAVTAVAGQTSYSVPWFVSAPARNDYKLFVSYRVDTTVWAFLSWDLSDNNFAITGVIPTITVTSPNGGESWARNTTHNLTWTVSSAVSTGEFQVWLYDGAGNWVTTVPGVAAVAGRTSYSIPYSVSAPARNDYKLFVSYRVDTTVWQFLSWDLSDNNFAITGVIPTITVTSPNGGETWRNGQTRNLTWRVSSAVSTGEFQVWLYDGAGNWVATVPAVAAVAGRTNYSIPWSVSAPARTDYRLLVSYRVDTTVWAFLASDSSNGNFRIR